LIHFVGCDADGNPVGPLVAPTLRIPANGKLNEEADESTENFSDTESPHAPVRQNMVLLVKINQGDLQRGDHPDPKNAAKENIDKFRHATEVRYVGGVHQSPTSLQEKLHRIRAIPQKIRFFKPDSEQWETHS
jgi:hypothetical protein